MAKKVMNESRELKYIGSGTLEEFIQNIRDEFSNNVPPEFQSVARLSIEGSSYDSWSAEGYVLVSWAREETDTEFNARIEQEKKYQEVRRQQYEQLKKEFG